MILIENILFLKRRFPAVWEKVKEREDKINHEQVRLEPAKNGMMTCAIHTSSGWNYLHSKYDPKAEADRVIAQHQEEIAMHEHVFFYGLGLGYHVEKFLERYPDIPITVYEPNINILHQFLSLKELNNYPTKQLIHFFTEADSEDTAKNLRQFVHNVKKKVLLIIHPNYQRVFREQTQAFVTEFRDAIFGKRSDMYAAQEFSKRIVINSINNLPITMKTPNILHESKIDFQDKPAILVSAGPSLDFEYENLRYIKENGLAYIFSVGSSINSLIEKGIYPDAAFTYDGSPENRIVFEKVIEQQIDQIPLVYGSIVGHETLPNYPGKKLHFLISRDFLGMTLLKREDSQELSFVESAKSIAIITLQVLSKLGCNPIILVGQNLAYLNDSWYAQGIEYATKVTEEQKQNAIIVKDVLGNDVMTNRGLDTFRKEMEHQIKKHKDILFINTTKGGAMIEGTTYVTLEEVIKKILTTKEIVGNDWVTRRECKYDIEHLKKQVESLQKEQKKLERIFENFNYILLEMNHAIRSFNFKELEKLFIKFDKAFDKLQSNKFNLLVIQQMNLQFPFILKMFEEIRFQKDSIAKAKRVISDFSNYLNECQRDMANVNELFENMYQDILENTEATA